MANHAGTTPIELRHDAGFAAAKIITFLRNYASEIHPGTVATGGSIQFFPNVVNVVPGRVVLATDIRDPDEEQLQSAENALEEFLDELERKEGVSIETERLARFEPVNFDKNIVRIIEQSANRRNFSSRRMTSGAGHDAQMMARICPAAMIFVPSKDGVSHNPREHTDESALIAGANVLLDVVAHLAGVSR